nr:MULTISPECIES: hypothetical protein [Klebsiella]
MLKIGIEGADGDPLKGGGGIAKGGKSKDTQIWTETKKAEPVGNAYALDKTWERVSRVSECEAIC